ncbi:hypothetical protein [Natrialba chahannaoensis]|uniref:hypothetical protein n=1 Tax=Natrialba chahannaoensis TaxID=68911 RepID=UPI00126860EC|nr:hypothetical protein [Natrialba chahannaoensis]
MFVGIGVLLPGCSEWVINTDHEDEEVLIVNNLTREPVSIELIVRGAKDCILYKGHPRIKPGKGFRTESFPAEAKTVEYVVNDEDSGSIDISKKLQETQNPGLTKITISYTTRDGMRYEE